MRGSFSLPCDLSLPPLGSSDQNLRDGLHMQREYLVNDVASSARIYHPTHRNLEIRV
jgi:hypothetical protein